MFEKYIVPILGVAAFVVGGLVAQDKAKEVAEVVRKSFSS